MRLFFPATARNRAPISAVLQELFPSGGRILEVASGSGEHAVAFAAEMPGIFWFPTDSDPSHLQSIDAWRAHAGVRNVAAARRLDVLQDPWPEGPFDAVFCANMVHIAPWEAAEALGVGASRLLAPGQRLLLYGPFRRSGAHTAPSNEAFDASLRARDPRWGVRDLEALVAAAPGFFLERVVEMPANNLILVLQKGE